jgi:antitoxin component YwqK of YwqJK toxin-antitoxin module
MFTKQTKYSYNGTEKIKIESSYTIGHLWTREIYRDGELEERKTWHPNGQIVTAAYYQDQKKETKWKYYNGYPHLHAFCEAGVRYGEYKLWKWDGTLLDHSYFLKDVTAFEFSLKHKLSILKIKHKLLGQQSSPFINSYIVSDLAKMIC